MPVFRVEKTKDYTVMSNHHLRDIDLSLKAKGLFSLMLSLPEDWDYTLAGLTFICKDGLASIRTSVNELEEQGYLTRRRLRNEKGQLHALPDFMHSLIVSGISPEIIREWLKSKYYLESDKPYADSFRDFQGLVSV